MKNILALVLVTFTTFFFAQNAAQVESQRVAEANYKRQVSNGAFEKATDEMRSSARNSSNEKTKQLNDDFEFNFARKEKFEAKLKSLTQKKIKIEEKMNQAKQDNDTNRLQVQLDSINSDLEKINMKLKENENELKDLQELFRKLNK